MPIARYLENEGLFLARGDIQGSSQRNIFGVQSAITDSFTAVWENATAYVYPSAATTLDVQTAATDTATIKIIGLDANY